MTRRRQETLLWIGALALGGAAIAGAVVLHGQMVVTQTGSGALQIGGPDRPLETGTGMILGRITDAGSSRPVAGAIATLNVAGYAPVRVMADGQGEFVFRDLPAGRFNLSATKPGYADGANGRMRPGGQSVAIDLLAGQQLGDVTVQLWKYGAITGRVMDESGDPVVGTSVRVLKRAMVAGRRQLTTGASDVTDDRGVYRIGSLEPGDYVVVVPMTQGLNRDALLQSLGLPRDVLATLPAGGGGGGGAMVFTTRVETSGSGGPIVIDGNDMGIAPAGTTADGHVLTYQTEFYPAWVPASRAMSVSIGSGDERGNIDFQLKPVRTVTISGTATSPDGQAGDLPLSLIPADSDDFVTPLEVASARTDTDGAFRFVNVPPGQYVLRAVRAPAMTRGDGTTTVVTQSGGGGAMSMTSVMTRIANNGSGPSPPLPSTPTVWGETTLGVGTNDIAGVSLALRTGLRVSGRVEFVGSAEQPSGDQLSAIPISIEPADGHTSSFAGSARGRIDSTGAFQTVGVAPGRYVLRVTAPRNWVLRGASYEGHDIVDAAVELRDGDASGVVITFTDRQSNVAGLVTGANGAPDATASVLAFPADRELWTAAGSSPRRLKMVRTGKDGTYTLSNLPAGDYFIVAVSDAVTGDWQNPEFLDSISRVATRTRVDEGGTQSQALKTASVQ